MQCKTTIAKKYDDGVIAGARCPNDAVKLGLCEEHLAGIPSDLFQLNIAVTTKAFDACLQEARR